MNAAIVAIGDEILIGQVTDTNSVWLSRILVKNGIHTHEMVTIADDPDAIIRTLDRFIGKVDILLITGGLGPTKDDLTKQTLADYFGGKLVIDENALSMIRNFFEKRGRTVIESNRQQALVPDNCKVLKNNHGTAPGMWFTKNETQVISMPGVPYEMKPMVEEQLIPALKERLDLPALTHKTVMTQGVPESYLAEMIKSWEEGLPECLKLAYLPRPGIVRLRLTARGRCAEKSEELFDKYIEDLKAIIQEHIYGYDDALIEEVVGEMLRERGLSLSTAESCTGGNIAKLITSIPGSSDYFRGSVVAYDNEIKSNNLGVKLHDLEKHGAVSREVVESMARGAQKVLQSSVSIATSGIAGPDGGTDDKPVGSVWISVANEEKIYSRRYVFGGNRDLVIQQSSIMALGLVRKLLAGIL